jgi:site-specific DNA recombinase
MGKRAALYLRVSTTRQAEKDLSIPDQRLQAGQFCARKGWHVVAEFIEPGASATSDKRPAFQEMIEEACAREKPFDVVIVHSFSRFFRDAYGFEHYRRRLERNGVEVVAITQDFGDDPSAGMVRQILNVFDEYQSKENGKHVLRAMKENARQGFWNGSPGPYGYKAVPVESRGGTEKKKLEVDPSEAEVVRSVFNLYQQNHGIRSIADTLNAKGLRYRKGRLFNGSLVHQMLTRSAYKGIHHFNKLQAKTRAPKDPSEWIEFRTPVIIDPEVFDIVQDILVSRRPTNTPPRITNGPTLLTGIAKCGTCGGGMTLRTGKGGRYRYYTCNARVTEGRTACQGRNIRMEALDELVMSQLEEKLFHADRLKSILAELAVRQSEKSEAELEEEKRLSRELRKTEAKIDRLYDAFAEGHISDGDGLRRNLSKHEQRREELLRQVSARKRRRQTPFDLLTPENVERFALAARKCLRAPDSAFRKNYLRMFVEAVEVRDGEIRITGSNQALAMAAAQTEKPDTAVVPSFVREWWAYKDSNLGPAD